MIDDRFDIFETACGHLYLRKEGGREGGREGSQDFITIDLTNVRCQTVIIGPDTRTILTTVKRPLSITLLCLAAAGKECKVRVGSACE